jgi:signal transduction histidine kinase
VKISVKKSKLAIWIGISCLVVAIGLFDFAYQVQNKEVETVFNNSMNIWSDDLARGVVEQDWLYLAKIGRSVDRDLFPYLRISTQIGPVFSYPNQDGVLDCKKPLKFLISRYGVEVGRVEACTSRSRQILAASRSGYFLVSLLLICIVVVFGGLVPLYSYRRSMLAMMDRLSALQYNSVNVEGDFGLLEDSDDPLTSKIMSLVGNFVNDQRLLQKKVDNLETSRALANMAAQVAHDIRSPISAINMTLKKMEGEAPDKIQIILDASNRINEIANDLLKEHKKMPGLSEMSENNEGCRALVGEEMVIKPLLDEIFQEKVAVFSNRSDVQLKIDCIGDDRAVAAVDRKELLRALSNLMNNAVEAVAAGGKVTLAFRPSKREIAISVTDNGAGIPEEVLTRLGKERVSVGKESLDSGSGIGVFHAAMVVRGMGGKFHIQSRVGMGTMVTMVFPRTDQDDSDGSVRSMRLRPSEESRSAAHA